MFKTASEWCALLEGHLEGDGSKWVTHPDRIESATEGAICFVNHVKYAGHVYNTEAAAVIVGDDMPFEGPVRAALIRVREPYRAYAKVLEHFNTMYRPKSGVDAMAHVHPTAQLGQDVYVGFGAVIGEGVILGQGVQVYPHCVVSDHCQIGDRSVLFPNVVLYPHVRIGKNCIIHAGTVIGSDGFGFLPQADGSYGKIPQVGTVIIEDDVEIGAQCTIDRGTVSATIIRTGVKMDNLIHVAHNVEIGAHTVIAAQTGIAGSTRIGKYCQIGGQTGIVGHLSIADRTRINAQSGVSKSIRQPGSAVTGSPAFEYSAALRAQALFRQLPSLMQRLKELEEKMDQWQKAHNMERVT